MPSIRSTSTWTQVGNVDGTTNPAVVQVPRPSNVQVGDLYLVFVFFGQAVGSATVLEASTPGFELLNAGRLGDSSNRLLVVYGRTINSAGDIDAIEFTPVRVAATGTRAVGIGVAVAPDAGYKFDLSAEPVAVSNDPVWQGTATGSTSFPSQAGAWKLSFVGTNTGSTSSHPTHAAAGGGSLAVQAMSVSNTPDPASDSRLSLIVGGTGVTYSSNVANATVNTLGITQVVDAGELDAEVDITGITSASGEDTRQITFDLTDLSSVAAGDLLVAVIRHQAQLASADFVAAGFARVGPAYPGSNGSGRMTGMYVRRVFAPSTLPAEITFTRPGGEPGRVTGFMLCLRASTSGQWPFFTSAAPEYTGVDAIDRATSTYSVPGGHAALELMAAAAEFTAGQSHVLAGTPTGFTDVDQVVSGGDIGGNSRTALWLGTRGVETPAGGAAVEWIGTPVAPVAQSSSFISGPPALPPGIPVTDVSLISIATSEETTATRNVTVPVPPGVEYGDVLLAHIRHQPNNSSSDLVGAGWERVAQAYPGASPDGRITGTYQHLVRSIEQEAYVLSRPSGATGRAAVVVTAWRSNVPGKIPSVVAYSPEYTGVEGTDRATSSYARPGGISATEVLLGGADFTAGNDHELVSTPSGFVEVDKAATAGSVGATSRTAIWVGARTAPSPSGGSSINWVGTPVAPVAQSLVVHVADPPPLGVTVWDGAEEVDATVTVWTGSREVPVSQVIALPETSYSISQMEADIVADVVPYWAHRGGSAVWPEMTMRAYTNAVFRGYKVLEWSAQRTSDGVWVGMHDATVDRVTALTGAVSEFTWAQLRNVAVDVPVGGGKIARLEDLLTAYPEMVLMVDNKPAAFFETEFLPLLKTVPNWADQVIVKIDGSYPVAHFETVKAAGFKVAGYFYSVDMWRIPERIHATDYPGLEYQASVGDWDTLVGYGKPTWGHVIDSVSAGATALAKGAHMLQVASVISLGPAVNEIL